MSCWHSACRLCCWGSSPRPRPCSRGRVGPPVLQPYYDLIKLFQKGSVFSTTTTWVFRAGPVVGLVTAALAVLLVPLAKPGRAGLVHGRSDPAGLPARPGPVLHGLRRPGHRLGLRGHGRGREVTFACLAEPAFFLGLLVLAKLSGSLQLAGMLGSSLGVSLDRRPGASLALVLLSWFIVLLAENSRIPFDDPNTHLELTMIHEVMVLDHSGPAFGMILYGAALKLFVFGALVVRLAFPLATGIALARLARLRRGDAGRRGGDRGRGIGDGPAAADARPGPAPRRLPVVRFWSHSAGEVNPWPSFSTPC